LFRTLGLSLEQIEKFEEIAARREEQQMDLLAILHEQRLTLQDPVLANLWLKIEPEYQAAQKELLGEAGYRQFRDYERAAPVRDMVSRYAGTATVMGVPFTVQQAEQLTQVMANASGDYRNGGQAYAFSIDWSIVDRQAAAILTEPQLNLLKTIEPAGQGGRFGGVWNKLMIEAQNADQAKASGAAVSRTGG
jgi:hypothetical protein